SSLSASTRAVDERGWPSIIDMKPIASLASTVSTTLSPIIIAIVPDCTMYMHAPVSPRTNTSAPAFTTIVAPALLANWRMSIAMSVMACPNMIRRSDERCYGGQSMSVYFGRCILQSDHLTQPEVDGTAVGCWRGRIGPARVSIVARARRGARQSKHAPNRIGEGA